MSKTWKSCNLWFSDRRGSQTKVSKHRSAAPTRNLRITCRGEDATSESNTPPGQISFWHTADFRRISTMFCHTSFKSVNSFSESFEFPPRHTFKRRTCKTSARSIGWAKSWKWPKVLDHGRWKFENREICWKLTSPGPKWRLKIQNRFADAKLTLRGILEVTRWDGLPLGE